MTEPFAVKVGVKKLKSDAQLPRYAHFGWMGDLAADLYSAEDVTIPPGTISSVSTGIALELPEGFGGVVEDRSGLALKGITTLAGVIDTGYRGEIKIVLTNIGQAEVSIKKGDRIAQLRIIRRIQALFFETAELSPTPRHKEGFGSTGK